MSKFLYVANTLQFENFVTWISNTEFRRIEIPQDHSFSFKSILGGDKNVFFVSDSSNRLVEIVPIHSTKTMKRLEKRNYSQTGINLLADNGEVDPMNMIEYSNLMEESNIYNIEYFMGKDAVYLVDKIEGRVGSFVTASGNVIIKDYSEYGGIYKFVTGPLSSCQVVLTKDGHIFENNEEIRFASVIDQRPTINKVACCGRGSILASTHDLYARGSDNVFHVFSQKFNELGSISKTEFVPIVTFEHEIIDIQCGYFHTVVLLANGELHACGYNCLHQSSWDSSTQELASFTKIDYSFEPIQKFGCPSRGTWVIDNSNHVTLVGEVVEKFTKTISNSDATPKIIKFNLDDYGCDTLTNCGWQYMMYKSNRRRNNFKEKLASMVGSERLSDIDFTQ